MTPSLWPGYEPTSDLKIVAGPIHRPWTTYGTVYLMPDEDPGAITWPCNGRDVLVRDTGMQDWQKGALVQSLKAAGAGLVVIIDPTTGDYGIM